MDATTIVAALEDIAPLRFAEPWDNVGLLIEGDGRPVAKVMLTIDLTAAVWNEAKGAGVDLIVAYHPLIFSGLKRLTADAPQGQTLLSLVRAGVAVYSPHTALDAVVGGVADWLLDGLGEVTERAPVHPDVHTPNVGAGRVGTLAAPIAIDDAVNRIKTHLGLHHVRVAGTKRLVQRAAVCPGAGGSMLQELHNVDLYVTGEMRHHDVLAKCAAGSAVILTDHTHCERGYLSVFRAQLQQRLGVSVDVVLSAFDSDPLRVV